MASNPGERPGPSGREPLGIRLDSWKEIAAHFKRHVTTVRRWEKREGLPVHRHRHAKLGSIYAYAMELDTWFERRCPEELPGAEAAASPEAPARSGRLPPSPAVLGEPRRPVDLFGRDAELKILVDAWAAACKNRPQVVFIAGEAGAGKTRLALELARTVATDATVLVGRCDSEPLVPFAPFVAMLQWLVRVTPPRTLRSRLEGIEGSIELAQLVPDISRRIHVDRDPVPSLVEGRRYRMFDAVMGLLAATSRACPTVLLFEDVHWADQGSLLLLRHVARCLGEAAICIIVTYREDEPTPAPWWRDIMEGLHRDASATRIVLGRLAQEHVRRLVDSWTRDAVPPRLAQLVAEIADGNPFFVTEMLRHLGDTGRLARAEPAPSDATVAELGLPESIRELIGRRVSRLSEAARKLLTVASVVGREFPLSVVETVADLAEHVLLDAIDEAVEAKIIVEEPGSPGRFSFAHTLVRETLYGGLTAVRRVRLHHRIGEAIEAERGSDGLLLGEVAFHFGQAAAYKDAEKAVDYAIRAADDAATTLAMEQAARYYDLALRTLDLMSAGPELDGRRVELNAAKGRCLFQVGHWALARSAFEVALSRLNPFADVNRCVLLIRLAETSFWLMDVEGMRRFAGEAETLAARIGRDDLQADALAWIASAKVADGDVLEGIEIDRRALSHVDGIRSFALARVPLTLYWAGRTLESAEQATRAVERARESRDPAFLLYALQHRGLCLTGAGCYDDALRAFDEALTLGRRCGALPLLARATSMSIAPLLNLGALDAAASRAVEARELARRVAFEPPLVSAGIDLLMIYARSHDLGRIGSLPDDVARAAQRASGWHAWKWRLRLWQARAELALARGDPSAAIVAAGHVVEQSRQRCRPKYEAMGLAVRARARQRLGRPDAVDDARAAADAARRLGDPAIALECLAVLLHIDGSDDLLAEARATVHRILAAVSQEPLRRAFLATLSSRDRRLVPPGADAGIRATAVMQVGGTRR